MGNGSLKIARLFSVSLTKVSTLFVAYFFHPTSYLKLIISSLFHVGWYSKSNKSKKQSHLKSSISTNNTPRGTPRPTTTALALAPTATQGTGQIPAIRPLDLSSLREHTTASAPTAPALESGVMFSARSTATTTARWTALHYNAAGGDAADTPRSWITAASMAASLPQSKDEMDAMDIEEVRQLVEDADVLQQRATVALKLAQARLRRQQQWRHLRNISAVFFVLLNLALMMIAAVVDLALIFMDVCVRLVCGQNSSISNSNSTALSLSSTGAEMVYAFLGGVAGAAQGIVMSLFGSSNTRVD